MPDLEETTIREEWSEVERLGLVGSIPSALMSREGAGNLRTHVTPFGWRFLKAIRAEP